MRIIAAIVSIVAAGTGSSPTGSTRSGPVTATTFATAQKLPDDVIAFRTKRDQCDQLRGEEPTDDGRAAFLVRELVRTCRGTDAALAGLRKRYANSHMVTDALAKYDSAIE